MNGILGPEELAALPEAIERRDDGTGYDAVEDLIDVVYIVVGYARCVAHILEPPGAVSRGRDGMSLATRVSIKLLLLLRLHRNETYMSNRSTLTWVAAFSTARCSLSAAAWRMLAPWCLGVWMTSWWVEADASPNASVAYFSSRSSLPPSVNGKLRVVRLSVYV